jgi:hypothetical protein
MVPTTFTVVATTRPVVSGRRAATLNGDVSLNPDGNGQTSAGAKLRISANF